VPKDLLPIGRFGRLCRLSVKRLRHYDDLGLLSPAHVDPSSGYRYYARTQIRDAMVIGLLRGLDVSLPALAAVLSGDDEARAAVLAGERDRLEREALRKRRTVLALERLLADGLLTQDVTLIRQPARALVVAETVGTSDDIGAATARCLECFLASGFPVSGPLWGVFPVDLDGPIRIAVGAEGTTVPPGLVPRRLAASMAVVTTFAGPYEHLTLAYQAIFAWIYEHGLDPLGTAYEAYLTSPPDEPVTRLVVPVESAEP
jgi:DNA-binding transcriptional MerR regulator